MCNCTTERTKEAMPSSTASDLKSKYENAISYQASDSGSKLMAPS